MLARGPAADHARRGRADPRGRAADRSTCDADLVALGYSQWLEGLSGGSPLTIPACFRLQGGCRGNCSPRVSIRAVLRHRNLALGINMPGENRHHRTAGQMERRDTREPDARGSTPQLTGRAGRRGIDVEGHAVVIWNREPTPVRWLVSPSTRTYQLTFRLSYNMAINLVGQVGGQRAPRCFGRRSRSSRPTARWWASPGSLRRSREALMVTPER